MQIQKKFEKLLKETGGFFSNQDQSPDEDRRTIDHLRFSALDLASDVAHPDFERFMAYLLGVTNIQTDYPLQTIRLMCLTLKLSWAEGLAKESRLEELVTAAFLADFGFRAAW